MKNAILIMGLIVGTISLNAQGGGLQTFDNEKYLKECGGKVYPKCDKDGLNQQTIYEEAKTQALASKRLLLLNIGADWCAPCIIMNEVMKAGGDELQKINEKFLIVKLNGVADSYKPLRTANQWPDLGYPNMIVVDPSNGRLITSFYPTQVKTVAGIRAELATRMAQASAAPSLVKYKWYPNTKDLKFEEFGPRLELLQRPIPIDAQAQILNPIVTLPDGPKKGEALAYYKQGLFYLFGFHYVDAARSLRSALLAEPNFYSAYLLMHLALGELGVYHGSDEAVSPLMIARQVSEKIKVSETEKAFAKYLEIKECSANARACKQFGIVIKDDTNKAETDAADVVIQLAKNSKNVDVMALAAQYSSQTLEEVLQISPIHMGAHHYLIHQYEGTNEYKKAVNHGAKFAELAPQIAHSHHMYGHILPKVGKWREAVERFLKADEIHKVWFAKNQARPWEDWHYEHNLNLLAHAYFFGREMNNAEIYWKRRCEDLKRLPCEEYFQFLILNGRGVEAEKLIKEYWVDPMTAKGGYDAKAAEIMSDELLSLSALMRSRNAQEAKLALARLSKNPNASKEENKFLGQLTAVVNFQNTSGEMDEITKKIQDSLASGGFDSWSESIFKTEFLLKLAAKMGFKNLASSIELSKQSVGFRCK